MKSKLHTRNLVFQSCKKFRKSHRLVVYIFTRTLYCIQTLYFHIYYKRNRRQRQPLSSVETERGKTLVVVKPQDLEVPGFRLLHLVLKLVEKIFIKIHYQLNGKL